MSIHYYAQLNDEGVCVVVSELSGEVLKENLVPLESYNIDLLGKKYRNGLFEVVPKTKEQLLTELKREYLSQIKDADLLGDTAEVQYLQEEYQVKKLAIDSTPL